jgi:hypothetical protein
MQASKVIQQVPATVHAPSSGRRARLLSDGEEEIAEGTARLDTTPPMSLTLTEIESTASLAHSIDRGRREYRVELEDGGTLSARVIGPALGGRGRRTYILRVLTTPAKCYRLGNH